MQFTSIPGPAKATNKGISINILAGDDISLDTYRLLIDVPCEVSIEPLPTPVDDEYELDGELD